MNERDIILEAKAELPDLDDSPLATRWPGTSDADFPLSRKQPTARRSEMSPTAVRIKQHSGVRVSRNKQLFPSLPHAIILSMCRTTTQTFTVICPVLFLSSMTNERTVEPRRDIFTDTRTDMLRKSWLRSSVGSLIRRGTKKWKRQERSVLPRGSVIQQNMTELASIVTRSTATQTPNSVTDGRSL